MTPDTPIDPDADEGQIDPDLDAIAAAILDGRSVDWTACGSGRPAEFASELRVVAEVADLHRSLPFEATARAPSPFPPAYPWVNGTLLITESLGRGAFGEVFRAWDEQLHRNVAVKLLFQGRRDGDVSPSLDEGRLLAKVRHPNVVSVYAVERIDGRLALITEFVDGGSLADVLRDEGPLEIADAARIGIDLCRALHAVHQAGLLHCDIKAQNVMREVGGRIVLMDFGAGRLGAERAPALSGPHGAPVGTPLYIAPEIWHGAPASVGSDVYSLGVLLFYIATGTFPVHGRSVEEIRAAHRNGRRRRLRDERPQAPRGFAEAVDRALLADPAARHESALSFEAAIRRVVERPAARLRNRLLGSAAAALFTILLIAGLAHLLYVRIPEVGSRFPDDLSSPNVVAGDTVSSVVKKLELPNFSIVGRPSRDGRFLPFSDLEGNLWVWELATGTKQQVTSKQHADEWTWGSLMSPDGSRVAYTWRRADKILELRVADTAAPHPQTLLTIAGAGAEEPRLLDWSQDARDLLLLLPRQDGTSDLALAATDGDLIPLQTFRTGTPRHGSISPDGRFVVFDLPAGDRSADRDVMIMSSNGSALRTLIGGRFNDLFPSWTPDGGSLFFTSDRSGVMGGWVMPVANGEAAGEPQLVARALGRISPLALTAAGYFYILQNAMAEVYTVDVDVTGNSPPGTPARVSPSRTGGHMGPAWSPDGRQLAYISLDGETTQDPSSNTLMVQDTRTGAVRRLLLPELSHVGVVKPQWAPEGQRLLVRGRDLRNREGLFVIDAKSGKLLDSVYTGQTNRYYWSAEGTSILYLKKGMTIVSHDLVSGAETLLLDGAAYGLKRILSFGASPDSTMIALSGATPQGSALMTWTAAAGLRELYRPGGAIVFQVWTPEGDQILFTRAGPEQPHRLMRISAAGGDAVDMNVPINGFTQVNFVALSPNGRQVAYTAGQPGVDIMLMERFLPR